MIAVLVMQMPAHQIIDMIPVRNRGMTAVLSMPVLVVVRSAAVSRRAAIRILRTHADAMLVDVIAVHMMQMPVVQIIHMPVVPNRGVPALLAVDMRVMFVNQMLLRHDSGTLRARATVPADGYRAPSSASSRASSSEPQRSK